MCDVTYYGDYTVTVYSDSYSAPKFCIHCLEPTNDLKSYRFTHPPGHATVSFPLCKKCKKFKDDLSCSSAFVRTNKIFGHTVGITYAFKNLKYAELFAQANNSPIEELDGKKPTPINLVKSESQIAIIKDQYPSKNTSEFLDIYNRGIFCCDLLIRDYMSEFNIPCEITDAFVKDFNTAYSEDIIEHDDVAFDVLNFLLSRSSDILEDKFNANLPQISFYELIKKKMVEQAFAKNWCTLNVYRNFKELDNW